MTYYLKGRTCWFEVTSRVRPFNYVGIVDTGIPISESTMMYNLRKLGVACGSIQGAEPGDVYKLHLNKSKWKLTRVKRLKTTQ